VDRAKKQILSEAWEQSHFVSPSQVIKDLGQQEVEQGPQLCQVVLEWRPCQQQAVGCLVQPQRPAGHQILFIISSSQCATLKLLSDGKP
jgi:hypothetical protein